MERPGQVLHPKVLDSVIYGGHTLRTAPGGYDKDKTMIDLLFPLLPHSDLRVTRPIDLIYSMDGITIKNSKGKQGIEGNKRRE
jgi:hypothetical protein